MQMSLPELISLISSVAALVTAIIVFFTLIEMKRQRQSSYKPDLICKPLRFSISANTTDNLQHVISTIDNRDKSDQDHHSSDGEVFNIGLGSAKNLCVTWRFDYEQATELVNKLNVELGLTISIEDNILIIKDKNGGTCIDLEHDLLQSIDYLLPVSIENKPAPILIPSSYVHLIGLYSVLRIYRDPEITLNFGLSDFPQLGMTTDFNDVGGKGYKKKHRVNPRRLAMELKHNDDGTPMSIKIDFLLEFKEL